MKGIRILGVVMSLLLVERSENKPYSDNGDG